MMQNHYDTFEKFQNRNRRPETGDNEFRDDMGRKIHVRRIERKHKQRNRGYQEYHA